MKSSNRDMAGLATPTHTPRIGARSHAYSYRPCRRVCAVWRVGFGGPSPERHVRYRDRRACFPSALVYWRRHQHVRRCHEGWVLRGRRNTDLSCRLRYSGCRRPFHLVEDAIVDLLRRERIKPSADYTDFTDSEPWLQSDAVSLHARDSKTQVSPAAEGRLRGLKRSVNKSPVTDGSCLRPASDHAYRRSATGGGLTHIGVICVICGFTVLSEAPNGV